MMDINTEPIKNWFGFTRRERRSTFILLLLIILIICLRYTIPDKRVDIENITSIIPVTEYHSALSARDGHSMTGPIPGSRNTGTKFNRQTVIHKSVPQKSRIDINISDSSTLIRLPGIGPVLSGRIIKYRRLLGGYASIEQLKEVYGLPVETFEKIKGRVFADSSVITRISINSAGYKELLRFPYLEKHDVTAILKYRELKGKITGITDLTENKLITVEKAKKVSPYLNFSE